MGVGVVVTTATRSGPSAPLSPPSSQVFVAGMCQRGSVTKPMLVQSMTDVMTLIGDRVSYGSVWDALQTYFNEGGEQAYIARVVGAAATTGTLTLKDRAGAPVDTLKIDAASPGDWSQNMTVEVRDGALPNSVRITVYVDGTLVQDITNITSPADAASKFTNSDYITVTDLGSATAAPGNLPALQDATALSAGTDDRASVADADYVAALDLFDIGLGDGAVCVPGQTSNTVWEGIDAHCQANHRIGLLAAPCGSSVDSLKTLAGAMDSEYLGLFAPWIQVSDGAGGVRTISPEGAVAAKRAQAHITVGPWRVPAGVMGKFTSVLGLDQVFTNDDIDELDDAKVSVIRQIQGGFRLYGWRSLSNDIADYSYLKDRDLLNRLVVEAEAALEDYVFAPIDAKGQLLSAVQAELVGLVQPIADANGLYPSYDSQGNEVDPGYLVDTGTDVNTATTLANNEIHAKLLVRVSPVGGLISLNIVKVGVLAGF